MERHLSRRRSSYFSGCMMSPSCIPVDDEMEYSRINAYCCSSAGDNKRGKRWRNLLRRLMRDRKSLHGSRPLSFNYDAVSYSQNFDDGCHHEESAHCSRVTSRDVRWKLKE
ncbi:hypothetical protein SLE2022_364300 [Rubroshorea leprosula]